MLNAVKKTHNPLESIDFSNLNYFLFTILKISGLGICQDVLF